jgi:peroxiredoxin
MYRSDRTDDRHFDELEEAIRDALGWEADAEPLEEDQDAPDLDLAWVQGEAVSPKFSKELLAVTFYDPSDRTSGNDLRFLSEIQRKAGDNGRVIAIAQDDEEDLQETIEKYELVCSMAADTKGDTSNVWTYRANLPVTYIIQSGKIVYIGEPDKDFLEEFKKLVIARKKRLASAGGSGGQADKPDQDDERSPRGDKGNERRAETRPEKRDGVEETPEQAAARKEEMRKRIDALLEE